MKYLLSLFVITLSLSVYSNDELTTQLKNKERNFKAVRQMYVNLKNFALKEDNFFFCELVLKSQGDLEKIYQDDYKLNQQLLKEGSDFSIDYSKKIYLNSASDIFAINNYNYSCEDNTIMPLNRFILDLNRSLENNHILSLSHKLFMQIFQGLNNL